MISKSNWFAWDIDVIFPLGILFKFKFDWSTFVCIFHQIEWENGAALCVSPFPKCLKTQHTSARKFSSWALSLATILLSAL